jgi:hypothetical protein
MKMKMLFDGWKIELLAFTRSHNALAVWHGCHFFASSQRNGERKQISASRNRKFAC